MKSKIFSLLIVVFLLVLCVLIITYSDDVLESVSFSISIWKDNLFPSIFPFFLISDLLVNYGFVVLVGGLFEKVMNKLFYLPGEASFALIGSMVSGFPSGSKYVRDIYDKGLIDEKDASYLLMFTHFSNPLFIIGTVGGLILNNRSAAFIILLCHMLGNFIIAFIFRKKKSVVSKEVNLKEIINKIHDKRVNNDQFIIILTRAIYNTFKVLILLLGIITSFLIFTTIINNIINMNGLEKSILSGILEMTQGIKNISFLNIPFNIKASLITSFLSFGGLSVHFQVKSIIANSKIKYKPFLIARILHALISGLLVFILV